MGTVEQVWLKNFNQVAEAIPESWRITVEDGTEWILPQYADEQLVRLHHELALVGFANGWL